MNRLSPYMMHLPSWATAAEVEAARREVRAMLSSRRAPTPTPQEPRRTLAEAVAQRFAADDKANTKFAACGPLTAAVRRRFGMEG